MADNNGLSMQLTANDRIFFRSRLSYASCVLLVTCLGLASRSKQIPLPTFIALYAGDTLWALMVFLLIGILFPSLSTWRVAALAALFSLIIEVSQLYHAPWLDRVRHTRPGALVLGQGFLWSDLVCYAIGIALGLYAELTIEGLRRKKPLE